MFSLLVSEDGLAYPGTQSVQEFRKPEVHEALGRLSPVPGKKVSWNVWEPAVLRGSFVLLEGQAALRAQAWSLALGTAPIAQRRARGKVRSTGSEG